MLVNLDPRKLDKLKKRSRLDALRLVYEWVKTDVINQKEFIHYLVYVGELDDTQRDS